MPETLRPTEKQHELLAFIATFIKEHGYSPSYREIMVGCNYTSVATVALHVNNLIVRGHVRKRDKSARSLEVINADAIAALPTNEIKPTEEKWLVDKIDHRFTEVEGQAAIDDKMLDQLYVLIGALKVLGLDGAAQSFIARLTELKKRVK